MLSTQPRPALTPSTHQPHSGLAAHAAQLAALRALIPTPARPAKADHLLGYPVLRGGRA